MNIISISHKSAPVDIRELFSFTGEEVDAFLELVLKNEHIDECVLVSTCNRSEVYFTGDNQSVQVMEKLLTQFKKADLELLLRYFLVYQEDKAISHLFAVTCGMDSMVLGEDEILGQVKEAYTRALNLGVTKYLLNTLFQAAITCAKKIKTDTRLSKTPVSIGTLVANEVFEFPVDNKTVLIIGLTGKMGTIIRKNLSSKKNISIIGTTRSHNSIETMCKNFSNLQMIEYKHRYQLMDQADIIISATTSPHYTVTYHELAQVIHSYKERLFIDLSVPMDIDKDITRIEGIKLLDIDYFDQAARCNTLVKEQETLRAAQMMEEHLDMVKKELVFRDFLPELSKVSQTLENRTLENIMYEVKEKADSKELAVFIRLMKKFI